MSKKNNFYGKDGGWYENYGDYLAANTRYEQQEKQNKLLEQQNRLLEQQNKLNYELEQEKIQKNYELEMSKIKHEENMRILRLFDDVGISKETFDAYVNSNFMNDTIRKLLNEKDEFLSNINKCDFLLHISDKIKELGMNKVIDLKEKLNVSKLEKEIENNCYVKINKDKLKEKNKILEKISDYKLSKKICIYVSVITLIIFFLLILGIENDAIAALWIGDGIISLISLLFIFVFHKNIEYCNNKLNIEYKDKEIDYNLKDKKIKERLEEEHKNLEKALKELYSNCNSKLEDLFNFRITHYNSKIEKLLIDVGFKALIEDLGLEYKKVNISNKKKEGSTEDYIEFFETNS